MTAERIYYYLTSVGFALFIYMCGALLLNLMDKLEDAKHVGHIHTQVTEDSGRTIGYLESTSDPLSPMYEPISRQNRELVCALDSSHRKRCWFEYTDATNAAADYSGR